MKKLLYLAAFAGMFAFVACGPSAEEKAKAEAKRIADSTAKADSINQIIEKARLDSIAVATAAAATADSIAKANEKTPKKGK